MLYDGEKHFPFCGKKEQRMDRRTKARIAAVGTAVLMGCLIGKYYVDVQERSCTKQLFAMDTVMSFTAYGRGCEEAVDAAMAEVQRLDGLLSTGEAFSEVAGINETGTGRVSEDTLSVLKRGQEIWEETGGLFDYTVYPLMELWGFSTGAYHVPSETELEEVLALVDASKVQWDGDVVTVGEGQRIDFGGIAKGYASARAMEVFREHGIRSGMVSLGGNVQVLGRKPDGSRWQVGIRNPGSEQGDVLAVVETEDRAVITSGGYERYFEENGTVYIHIIDPETGWPADGDLSSVTVVSEDGTLADALSTSLYLLGYDAAVEYWKARRAEFDMVLITDQGEISVTEGIRDGFRSEREYRVLDDGVMPPQDGPGGQ